MKIEGSYKDDVQVIPEIKVAGRDAFQRAQQKFGVGELLYLGGSKQVNPKWKIIRGGGTLEANPLSPGDAKYFCPATAATVKLEFSYGFLASMRQVGATVEFEVVAPEFHFVKYHVFHYASNDPNAGFRAAFIMTPDTVSFARVALRECGGANVWTKLQDDAAHPLNGIMTAGDHTTLSPVAGKKHTDDNVEGWAWYIDMAKIKKPTGSYSDYDSQAAISKDPPGTQWVGKPLIRTVGGVSGTVNFRDSVYNPIMTKEAARPWLATDAAGASDVLAEYYLDIPVHYAVIGKEDTAPVLGVVGTYLATNRHSFKVSKDGKLTVSKGTVGNIQSVTYAIGADEVGVDIMATI
jgi:hypothetical protein